MIIRGGHVVTPSGVIAADVAIAEGSITEIGPDLSSMADGEVCVAALSARSIGELQAHKAEILLLGQLQCGGEILVGHALRLLSAAHWWAR